MTPPAPQPDNSARSRELLTRVRKARVKLTTSLRDRGVEGAVREFLRLAGRACSLAAAVVSDLFFDLTSGVRTRGVLHNGDPVREASLGGDPKSYGTTPLSWWKQMSATLPVEPGGVTFVDLGAGRGRMLILAAKVGYERVIGVELDPTLADEARANIDRWLDGRGRRVRRSADIDVVTQDAATFVFPSGPLLVGLFNPFGPATLEPVLRNLCEKSHGTGDDLFVAYFYPRHADVFERFPELELYSNGRQWKVYRLRRATS